MKAKAMISIPMTGVKPEVIKLKMAKYKKELNGMGYDVIDTYLTEQPSKYIVNKDVWYIGKSIVLMSEVNVLYMAKGWDESRGCKIEHQLAKEYGVEIIYEK